MPRLTRKAWRQFLSTALPYWTSDQKWTPIGLSALLLVLLLAYTEFSVVFNRKLGAFASALAARDADRFWSDLRIFLYLLILAVPINAFYYYIRDKLAILWRRWLTIRFLGDYFGNRAYYDLSSNPAIDNPDQRIADDINTFTQRSLQFLLIAANGAMQLAAFSAVLWSLSKTLVAFLLIYAAVGTSVTIFAFGRGLTLLNYLQLQKEADLRFSLVRVRENAESIAFYQGEDQEQSLILRRFAQAFRNFNKLIWRQLFLSMFQYGNSYASYLLPYLILAPRILAGELEVGTVVEACGAFSACLVALNLVIDNFDSLSKFTAGIDRLDSFRKAIEHDTATANAGETIASDIGDVLTLEHVTLKTPLEDRVLIKDLSVAARPGDHLVITGPSGCGKTSLLRAIMGLWTHGHGSVQRPDLQDLLFLPQRPYMIPGSLRNQLLYPRQELSITDAELRRTLKAVKLERLLEGDRPLDAEADWSKLLSIGEQQRLAFARLLLLKPRYAFLDEATSALDEGTEDAVYRLVGETETTVISVSHHSAVRRFHRRELALTGDGDWKLRRIRRRQLHK